MNKQEIQNIKEAKVVDMTKDEVFEIVRVLNIKEGRETKNNFCSYTRFGMAIKKEGRINYDVLVQEAPTLIADIKTIEGSPKDIIEEVYPALIRGDANYDAMDDDEKERAQNILKETHELEQKGVIFNTNLIWEIWKIIRGEECEKFMKESGLPIDLLIEMYSHFSEEQVKEIKEKYHAYF